MTNATDQISEADTAEAVKLNQNAQKPTLYALDKYAASHPRLALAGSNGRLTASMACGWTLSDENVSVI